MSHTLKNQDAWQRLLQFNSRAGFPYQEWELRRMHRKYRQLGRLVRQPASLRNSENHN